MRVMVPHDATLDTLAIDPSLATGRGILQSIRNKPKTFDLESSAVFFQRGGVWLDNAAPVGNYDLKENVRAPISPFLSTVAPDLSPHRTL